MAKVNGAKTNPTPAKPVAAEPKLVEEDAIAEEEAAIAEAEEEAAIAEPEPAPAATADLPQGQEIDDCLNALKTLLSTVEKLQKVRLEVGDIKPLLVRMLDGEVLSGDELEQLKAGVGGLFKLVRAYSDHQTALNQAQPARSLLDQVLKPVGKA